MYIINILLEGIFRHDLTDEIPNLIAFFSSQEHKSAAGVDVKEGHTIDSEILFGEFKVIYLFSFVDIPGNHAERESSSLSASISDIV